MRRSLVVACILLSQCPGFASRAIAAVTGPLAGRELSIARELQSGLESLAGSLLAGDLRGDVLKVVVTEDSPRRLTVSIRYTGFAGGKLWGEVLESKRSRQAGVSAPEPVMLSGSDGEIELTFEATAPFSAATARSPYLRINAAHANKSTPSYRRSFDLGKIWGPEATAGADFLVTVSPRPIGRTAELGLQPTMVVPTGSVVSTSPASPARPPSAAPAPSTAPPPPAPAPAGTDRKVMMSSTRGIAGIGGTRAVVTSPTKSDPAKRDAVRGTFTATKGMVAFDPKLFGLQQPDIDRGARGPAVLPFLPFGDVRTEDVRLDLARLLNFSPEIYPDQNPESGIYYFLPHDFGLDWDAVSGYQLRTVYSSASASGAAGEVLMSANLDAGIGAPEVQLASAIVKPYVESRRLKFNELRALPIDTLSVSLSGALGQFSIPADKIAVNGLSDVMGQIDVSWITDERTTAFIQEALVENVGISGDVLFSPIAGGPSARSVPVRIRLADFGTFGPFRWDRAGWHNPTPYPITLRYLHALRIVPGHPPVVHSWSLADTKVPPGGQVRWNATGIPFWLDRESQRMWLDYTVDGSCTECGSGAIAALTGGVSGTAASEIVFHTITPLADAGALEVIAEVRSRYFDPRARDLRVRQVVLDADGKDFRLGPVFPGDRANGDTRSGDPLFEFRLLLTMKDGRPESGEARWIPSHELRVPVGRFQLETSLGAMPAR